MTGAEDPPEGGEDHPAEQHQVGVVGGEEVLDAGQRRDHAVAVDQVVDIEDFVAVDADAAAFDHHPGGGERHRQGEEAGHEQGLT